MSGLSFLLALIALIVAERLSRRVTRLERAMEAQAKAAPASAPPSDWAAEHHARMAEQDAAASRPAESVIPAEPEPASPTLPVDEVAAIRASAAARVTAETPPPPPFPKTMAAPPRVAAPSTASTAKPMLAQSLEFALGTRWSVWVGALLLAFGAIFLVKYSIEAGFFGPAFRVLMGLVFGAALLAAGERLRRRDPKASLNGDGPNIPALLTGVGALSLFGAIYAAYAFYGFLYSGVAFVLLAAIGIATMTLSLLHGPALAGLGLVGALAVPMLITSRHSSVWSVALYVPLVALFAHTFAWTKGQRYLAIAASVGLVLWTLMLAGVDPRSFAASTVGLAGLALILVTFFLRPALAGQTLTREWRLVDHGMLFLQAFLLLGVLGAAASSEWIVLWMIYAAIVVALPLIVSRQTESLRVLGLYATGFVAVLVIAWPSMHYGLMAYDPSLLVAWSAAALAAVVLTAVSDARSSLMASTTAARITTVQLAAAPPLILAGLLLKLTNGETSVLAGLTALACAVGYGRLALDLNRQVQRAPEDGRVLVLASTISAALGCVTLAWFFLFDGVALSSALAVNAAITARIAMVYRVPVLRMAVPVLAALVLIKIGFDPLLIHYGLGTTPIWNGLLLVYGLPMLAFAYAGYVLGGPEDREDAPVVLMQTAALLVAAVFAAFEVRHLSHGGVLVGVGFNLVELGLDVAVLQVAAILFWRLVREGGSLVYAGAARVAAYSSIIGGVAVLGLLMNPVFGVISTWVTFGDLVIGYGLPALLAFALVRVSLRGPEPEFLLAARVAALWLAFLTVSLLVRYAFQGPYMAIGYGMSQIELYAYSVVWLAIGAAFMAYGFRFHSWPARAAAFILLFGTAGKVFLLDMAGLSGLYRAASFIALGVVLMVIGLAYQRLGKAHVSASSADAP